MDQPVAYLLPHQGSAISLDPAQEHVLGRQADASISVTNTMISRRHCVFVCRDGMWILEDCGSRNGVLVNGARVQQERLMEQGDIVNVAGEQWTFGLLAKGQDPQAIFRAGDSGSSSMETMELDQGLSGLAGSLDHELTRAAEIQSKMLVEPPTVAGWDIAAHTEGVAQLNGDFYDIAERKDGRVQVLLGDVCGHGVHAALFGTTILKSNRLLRDEFQRGRDLIARLNAEACRDTISGHFATVFMADFHPASGQVVCMLAGHHPAYVYRKASGEIERLGKRGIALGITESEAFEKAIRPATFFLEQGDVLLQLTDGFLEATDAEGEPYEDEGVERFLKAHSHDADMASLCRALNQELHGFTKKVEDDLTVIAIRCDCQPDKDLAPKGNDAPSATELGQQAQRRIAYHICRSAHDHTRLQPPRRYLIGRSHEADIQVVDSHVSRRHCLLIWDDERTWVLRDLGSRNGLIVNGSASDAEEIPLSDGDRLQVGPDEFTYRAVPAGVDLAEMLQRADDDAIMATIEAAPEDKQPSNDLSGAIDGMGIIDLMQYCRMTRRSGQLAISGKPGGSIWIKEGMPVHALCGQQQGRDAIIALVTSDCSAFVLSEAQTSKESSISGSFDDLLMNLALHIDQIHRDGNDSSEESPFDSEEELPAVQPAASSDGHSAASTVVDRQDQQNRTTDIIKVDTNLGKHAGQQLGQVKLGVCIGRGANAEVYRGEHLMLQLEVAVKVLKGGNDEIGEKARHRLVSEAQLAARVRHPRVIQVIDAGIGPEGEVFLVEEFVNGSDLGRRLENGRPLAVDEVLRLAKGIVEGLVAIHAQGIIHRDLKPDNIMVDERGEVHISDLGLAHDISDATVHRLTRTGAVLGTPAYVSPEAIRDSKNISFEADIYSLGATLYHLLSGAPPYKGHSAYEVMQKHLQGRPVPLSKRRPGVPPALSRLVLRCLHLDPSRRPTAADLLEQLERIAESSQAKKSTGKSTVASSSGSSSRMLSIIVIAVLLIAAGALWWLLNHG